MRTDVYIHRVCDTSINRDPKTGEFTAGGMTASQHEAQHAHHELSAMKHGLNRSHGASPSKNETAHYEVGNHHRSAAEHLKSGRFQAAEESAAKAEHGKRFLEYK